MAYKTQDQINRDLAEKDTGESELQKKLLEYAKPLLKAASDKMCRYHTSWENYDWLYRGYRLSDREDKESASKGEPTKIIVPLTFAQVQTAISFLMATYMQKRNFFEFDGMGSEDSKLVFGLETDISYQLGKNAWPLKLYYLLLDVFKYGFGVVKTDWKEDYCYMRVQKKVPIQSMFARIGSMFGRDTSASQRFEIIEEVAEVLEFEGNRIRNISPFSFYPDPNLPIAKFQEGSFVCHEEERSKADVEKDEGEDYFGTDMIPDSMSKELHEHRSRWAGREFAEQNGLEGTDKSVGGIVLSELQFRMTGKMLNEKFGLNLEPKDYQNHWGLVMGNDSKVIQFKPLGYLHNSFTYDIGEYSPDSNAFYNPGLAETIQELQSIITFFLNSHVINVKKLIANRFIGDPQYINMDDVKKNELFIRMQGNPPGDIDRYFKQLSVVDATRGHVADMDTLSAILQQVTGVNENALGQYASGRRSATEARNVSAGAAARLKMHGTLIWNQCLEQLGKKLVSNTRQGRSRQVYEAIVGRKAFPGTGPMDPLTGIPTQLPPELPFEEVILANPDKIAGGYDFMPFDGTLPSERQQIVAWFTELFTAMIGNEQAMLILQKDPTKMLNYMAQLLNIKNLEDFNLTPDQPLMMPQPVVTPDAEVEQAIDDGAEPVDLSPVGGMQ